MKFYNYKPDTCGCFICQAYDEDEGAWSYVEEYTVDGKVYTTQRCEAHEELTDIDDLFDAIYGNPNSEQKRKNLFEKELLENEAMGLAEIDKEGNKVLKAGTEYNWSFEGTGADRQLIVDVVDTKTKESVLDTKGKGDIEDGISSKGLENISIKE